MPMPKRGAAVLNLRAVVPSGKSVNAPSGHPLAVHDDGPGERWFRLWSLLRWLPCLLWLLLAAPGPAQQSSTPAGTPQALVVTLRGKLTTTEIARAHRALRTAVAEGVGYVVFRFEFAGDLSDDQRAVQGLLDQLQWAQQKGVGTVALVQRAESGAAYLALCCDRIYFLAGRNHALGNIAPTDTPWQELLGLAPDDAALQRFAGYRQELLDRLQLRPTRFPPDALKLAQGMIDPGLQLVRAVVREQGIETDRVLDQHDVAALQAGGATIVRQQPVTRPVMLEADEAEQARISLGTVQGLDQLCTDILLLGRDAYGELQDDWAEHMVSWLELLQPFLLVAGFVLLLIELKTPGVGLPGLLGLAFLALALFYSYLTGLAEVAEILLFFLGIAALAVEIFLLPGTIVFGAIGFVSLVLALILSRQSFVLPGNAVEDAILLHNLLHLFWLLIAVLVSGALLRRVLPHVPWLRSVLLPPPAVAASPVGSGLGLGDPKLAALVGRVGVAVTVLRPAGVVELDGDRIDVVTDGDFVPAGARVRVVAVQGNRVEVTLDAPTGRDGERGSAGIVLLLVVVGLALIVAEVMFVSFGVIATLAGAALIGAVFLAFQDSTAFGTTVLVSEAVLAPIVLGAAFKLLPRTRFGKALLLEAPSSQAVSASAVDPAIASLLHKTGVAVSPLRPAGFARIDGRRVDVVTRGEMLDEGCPVRVVDTTGNRVVVAADR